MNAQNTEKAFETYLEESLTEKSGWNKGSNKDWDSDNAIFPTHITSFIEKTQPDLWEKMKDLHGDQLEVEIVKALIKELNQKGTIEIVRNGFKFHGKRFAVAYFRPANALNEETLEKYKQNHLTVTRQILCHPNANDTIDMLFSINGLPVATCELKNPRTGQNWRHAIKQYKEDRNPGAPLFTFQKRALVHFAADPNEIYMATRLAKEKTFFLPFNRGSKPQEMECGSGNPQHESGYRTGYFWEEVLQRDSFLDIIKNFIFIERKEMITQNNRGERKKIKKETLIFPRYHQLDVVRKLISQAKAENAGKNYLVQHSAGSGKTNSISWLSHRLSSLHNDSDEKIFDCVIVITDRTVLDSQLQEAVYQIEHAQGVVKAIDKDSKQLADSLIDGTKIVVTTLQKFPFVLKGLLRLAGAESTDSPDSASLAKAREWEEKIAQRKYAVIVDEAHSSQSGETARELKAILGAGTNDSTSEEGEEDWQDGLNQVMDSRGGQTNLSFYAFTATPKGKTLELFGRNNKPSHIYSMRQAIEERFILDVLENYTTYNVYFKLLKKASEDPDVSKKKAAKKLTKFMALHDVNINQKTEIMIEHFRQHVLHQMNGKAKAMVVTGSRESAVRYMLAFQKYIDEKKYSDIRPLVAFSGKVHLKDKNKSYTEPEMNIDVLTGKKISETQLREKFDTDLYQVLLVANKYQTGFDQPLLHTMYVDKKLSGVQAVQTLSRLNRNAPGKKHPFVLDFVNKSEDIYDSFKPYYDTTVLQDSSDPGQLEVLKHELDNYQIYHWSEVEAFSKIYYKPIEKQNSSDHARLEKHVAPAVDRYKSKDKDSQKEFKDKLGSYIKLYSYLSQIMPFSDSELEMLYSYSRHLITELPFDSDGSMVNPEDKVALHFFRIERVSSGAIDLNDGEFQGVKPPVHVGGGREEDDRSPLSQIIDTVNERFGTEFKEEDRLFFEQIKEKAVSDDDIIQTAEANTLDKFELGIKKSIEDMMIQRISENDELVSKYLENIDFQKIVLPLLAKDIYKTIKKKGQD